MFWWQRCVRNVALPFNFCSALIGKNGSLCFRLALGLEYEDVLKRRTSVVDLEDQKIDEFLWYLLDRSRLLMRTFRVRPSLPDPKDEHVLEAAVFGRTSVVTYNVRDFLPAAQYGVFVLLPLNS